jgi:alkanesulfonate monooxygenase SsuD/methylene tetrahydromethanopterin reductase-like flavin-dependent oxidoreductase (luciferase family)
VKFGIVFPGGTPRQIVDLAVAAEAAGWDGVFCFEGIYHYDPWTTLGAVAVRTEKVKLGTMLTPAPRRRPWKLAAECVTLDRLSSGRTVLSVGIGAFGPGLGDPGEERDAAARAERLDETIDLLRAMWSGEPVVHKGKYYDVDLPAGPKPVQKPSIPIWCVGIWPRIKSMQRVLRCDGIIPQLAGDDGRALLPEAVAWVRASRSSGLKRFDVIAAGTTSATSSTKAAAMVRPWAEAGATWWIEEHWGGTPAKVRRRIEAGPPQS